MMKIYTFVEHFGIAGGGERHACSFVVALSKHYDVTVGLLPGAIRFLPDVEKLFGISLDKVRIENLNRDKIAQHDVYMNISHFQILKPMAPRNILVTFFPQMPWDTKGYDTIIANSHFTKAAVAKNWKRYDAVVIYPPCDTEPFEPKPKKKRIVTVGRFFEVPQGNNKNHIVMVDAFKELGFDDWEFHLVGSIHDNNYLNKVKKRAGDDPRIKFHHDLTLKRFASLLNSSNFYWHAAGYGTTELSSMEHFGLMVVEGAAAGAIPIVHNSGGMVELGSPTWDEPKDLVRQTRELVKKPSLYEDLQAALVERAELFSDKMGHRRLIEVIEEPLLIGQRFGVRSYRVGSLVGAEPCVGGNVERVGKIYRYYCGKGQTQWIEVEVKNLTQDAWDPKTHMIGAYWTSWPDGCHIVGSGKTKVKLASAIGPGESVVVGILVPPSPISAGRLVLQIDVLHNGVAWLTSKQAFPRLDFRILP